MSPLLTPIQREAPGHLEVSRSMHAQTHPTSSYSVWSLVWG